MPSKLLTDEEAQRLGYIHLLSKVFAIPEEEIPLFQLEREVPKKVCAVCGQVIVGRRYKYCSKECDAERRKYKNRSLESKTRHNALVARWQAEHPEQAREIQSRASANYQRKKTKLSRFDKMAGEMLEQR